MFRSRICCNTSGAASCLWRRSRIFLAGSLENALVTEMNIGWAAPEILLLTLALAVLVIDLFVSDGRRNISYGVSLLSLAAVTVLCGRLLVLDEVRYAFGGMYVTDPMTNLLKVVSSLLVGFML